MDILSLTGVTDFGRSRLVSCIKKLRWPKQVTRVNFKRNRMNANICELFSHAKLLFQSFYMKQENNFYKKYGREEE